MKKYSSRAEFLRTLGLDCTNSQGQYSFVNDEKKQVFFGLDQRDGINDTLILADEWKYTNKLKKDGTKYKNSTYSKSIPHIDLIENQGYELFVYKTLTSIDDNGAVHATTLFQTEVENRKLERKNDGYHALKHVTRCLFNVDLETPKGTKKPAKDNAQLTRFVRDLEVKNWVLNYARGNCECCGKSAPFTTSDGKLFLEVHHLLKLADEGSGRISNVVALCPNCHKEIHYGANRLLLTAKMYKDIDRLIRE